MRERETTYVISLYLLQKTVLDRQLLLLCLYRSRTTKPTASSSALQKRERGFSIFNLVHLRAALCIYLCVYTWLAWNLIHPYLITCTSDTHRARRRVCAYEWRNVTHYYMCTLCSSKRSHKFEAACKTGFVVAQTFALKNSIYKQNFTYKHTDMKYARICSKRSCEN